ncbi:MAG: serine hydrolase domain-containing protein [Pseudomonadota bacterium]
MDLPRRGMLGLLVAQSTLSIAGCGASSSADRGVVNQNADVLRGILLAESAAAGTAAVIAGMWSGQEEVVVEATGYSTPGVPAAVGMHYRIGGITETFLVTLLFMLAEQGRIDLDAKISRWFPELIAADQVTARMLAGNTAGYIDYVNVKDWLDRLLADPFSPFTDDELIQYSVRDGKMRFSPPGSSWAYSHTEYVILGQVIQRATGESIGSLYQRYLLTPLGLHDTQLPAGAAIQAPALHAYMLDRGSYEDSTAWTPSWAMSYGGLTSTVRDLGRWARIFGRGLLVSPASHREITAPARLDLRSNPPALYFAHGFIYANGWYLQNPDFNGYSGAFAYNPTHDLTLVVVATKNNAPAIDPAAIHILRKLVSYVTPGSTLNF